MNPGVNSGIPKSGWKDYQVEWKGVVPNGQTPPTVQPSIGNGSLIGRYVILPSGVVMVDISLTFGSTTVAGTGDNAWLFGLPVPFNRFTGSSTMAIGEAILQQDPAGSPNFTVSARPSFPVGPFSNGLNNGREDYFIYIDNVQSINAGTSTITGTNTSVTVTHGLGYTPYAWDIQVIPTAITAGSAAVGLLSVTNVGSTSFDVNCAVAPGVGKTLSFSWKCNATPGSNSGEFFSTVANSKKPWAWTTNHSLSLQVLYPPRS